MKKKWKRREKPLCTFDELLNAYGIEFVDAPDQDGAYIPLIDDDGNSVKLKLDGITLEELDVYESTKTE
jgi:hypothetical protein